MALSAFAAPAIAAFALPMFAATLALATGVLRTCSQNFARSGSSSHLDQVAFRTLAAFIAAHSLSATTARELFWRTTCFTPLIPRTEASSTRSSVAPMAGGRTTRAWSMSGTRKSCM